MAKFNVMLGTTGEVRIEPKRGIALVTATKSIATVSVIAENHLMAAVRALTYVQHVDRDKVMLVRKGEKGQPHRFRVNEKTGDVEALDSPFYDDRGGI